MNTNEKKALLAVSFGTSYQKTRQLTIEAIEAELADAFPNHRFYRAWTSKMIMAKLKREHGMVIHNVKEAMAQMLADGITDVVVQPTHIMNGIENDLMKSDALSFADHFHSIFIGDPLLSSQQDNEEAIQALMKEWEGLSQNEALVLMGHGTTHFANSVYAAMDYTFKDMGYPHVSLGTVEAYPSLKTLLKQIRNMQTKKVHLAPFMIVAGDHANNDMAGDNPKSWKYQFEQAGFEVECHMKGLGEYEGIRKLFVKHALECCN